MGGDRSSMKYIFMGIDFALCLMGGTMLGVGIWMAVDPEAEENFAEANLNEDLYWSSVYIMITVGSLLLIASILGFIGANSQKWALFAFIGIICVCLILELTMIIITGVFWDSLDAGNKQQMIDEVQDQYVSETANDSVSVKWNNMQIDWKCCGARDFNDYDDSLYRRTYPDNTVPWTCCVMYEGGRTLDDVVDVGLCRYDATDNIEIIDRNDYLHRRGCYSRMNDFFSENSLILILLTIFFAACEVGGLVVAFLVMRD